MSSRALLLLAVALCQGGVLAGCSAPPDGPGPGSNDPGQPCSQAVDCGCWQCDCEGVSGAPGAAQLCMSGVCPTGEAACTPVCALAGAKVASATAVDACSGRP